MAVISVCCPLHVKYAVWSLLTKRDVMDIPDVVVRVATPLDEIYARQIVTEMEDSAKARGTGIARRSVESIQLKIREGKAVIALTKGGDWVGFSYIESWSDGAFVSNSGLIVSPAYRQSGVAKAIKKLIFALSRKRYPNAQIFSITSGAAMLKINYNMGFKPVTFPEITQDDAFWKGCSSCPNYSILEGKGRKNCLCTAMLFDPREHVSVSDEAPIY